MASQFGPARNPHVCSDGLVTMRLTQGKDMVFDAEDFYKLAVYRWCAQKAQNTFYARTNSPVAVCAHTLLLPEAGRVDHINGDGLDNRRCNLRPATVAENASNRRHIRHSRSGYKGVSQYQNPTRWRAQIVVVGKPRHLGYFPTAEDAARAYDAAALEYFGEYARTNRTLGLL